MSTEKKQLEKITTPAGIAKYPKLNKPETEVNGQALDKPRFTVGLILDEKDKGVKELREKLETLHASVVSAAEKKKKADPKRKAKQLIIHPVVRPVVDDEGNEVAGKFEIRAKTNAENKDGDIKVITMFDAKGKPTKANVGGGSKLRLSVSLGEFDTAIGCGVALYLNAVQILDLKTWGGGGDASSHGFSEEEGYEDSGSGNADETVPEDAATGGDEGEEAPARSKGDF
jgi:hypothetical protein